MADLKKYPQHPKAKLEIEYWGGAYYGLVGTYHPKLGFVSTRLHVAYSNEQSLIKDAATELRKLINCMLEEADYPKVVDIDLTPEPEPVKQPGFFARLFGAR